MLVSTKGRYALRIMLELAQFDRTRFIPLPYIAEREGISEKYLEQIISILNSAGFVRSIRGAQGGYILRKEPSEYTVGMILRLTEGSLAPVACIEDNVVQCDRVENCATIEVWRRLNDAINGVVDNITLADLVEWQNNNKENYTI